MRNDELVRIDYDKETDSLHMKVRRAPSAESKEVAPGTVIDFDASGVPAGIDFEHASTIFDTLNLTK